MNFKIVLETGCNKKKHSNCSRTVPVRADNIVDAYSLSNKMRGKRVSLIVPITHEEYMLGVAKKYKKK